MPSTTWPNRLRRPSLLRLAWMAQDCDRRGGSQPQPTQFPLFFAQPVSSTFLTGAARTAANASACGGFQRGTHFDGKRRDGAQRQGHVKKRFALVSWRARWLRVKATAQKSERRRELGSGAMRSDILRNLGARDRATTGARQFVPAILGHFRQPVRQFGHLMPGRFRQMRAVLLPQRGSGNDRIASGI